MTNLKIKIEVMVNDEMINKAETSVWEIAEQELDRFRRKFELEQANQQEDAMNK